ncbi:MAG: hypothetical protein WC123_07590 [Bacilli bacterium]
MINTDKIIKNVPEPIIEIINLLAKGNNRTKLTEWLEQCKQEIEFRTEQKIDMNWLYYEKYYLEMILG